MINDAIIVHVLRHVGATDLSQRTEVLTIVTFRYYDGCMLGNGPRYFRPVMYISVKLIFLPLNMKVESMSCGNPLFRFFVTLLQVL